MAASYPASLPVKDAAGANLSTNPHSALHDGMYDEIVALATELGTSPKGVYASVKARLDAMPRGFVGLGVSSAASTTSGSTTLPIAGCSVTFTAVAGRRYKATADVTVIKSVAADGFIVGLWEDTPSQLDRAWGYDQSVTVPAYHTVGLTYTNTASISGSVTWYLAYSRDTGTGTLSTSTTTPFQSTLLIEDIGPL